MKDINDKQFGKFAKYTIIPGLFVNNVPTEYGKILVFCGKKDSDDGVLNFESPIFKELNFKNTIKDSNLKDSITCNLIYDKKN